jgi:hypothetical protein
MPKALENFGIFFICLLLMLIPCTWTWDSFVNGHLYYCTDCVGFDFLFAGDWVHHPVAVAHIVPRSMSEPDEIKQGWGITGLWCLWGAFVFASAIISVLISRALWLATKSDESNYEGRLAG